MHIPETLHYLSLKILIFINLSIFMNIIINIHWASCLKLTLRESLLVALDIPCISFLLLIYGGRISILCVLVLCIVWRVYMLEINH